MEKDMGIFIPYLKNIDNDDIGLLMKLKSGVYLTQIGSYYKKKTDGSMWHYSFALF